MLCRRYCRIISNPLKKIVRPNNQKNTASTSFPIPASSKKARVNLNKYIIKHPGNPSDCLKKILYAHSNGTTVYETKYNEYWKENIKLFKVTDCIAELTRHIPPKHNFLDKISF